MAELTCPECGAGMTLKSSRFGPFYGCARWPDTGCPGSHGAHPDGTPLGVPANRETKAARVRAHAAFDTLWRGGGMKRRAAYRWMQDALGLTSDEAHIGRFDVPTCERLIAAVEARRAPEVSRA
jgi:ssDNA-binding Zn-finger/Zn-ribbon topoisomerase 1